MEIRIGDEFEVVGSRRAYLKIVTSRHLNCYGQPDGWRLERHVIGADEVRQPYSWEREETLLDPKKYRRRSTATAYPRPFLRVGPNFFPGAGFYWRDGDGRVLRAEDFTDQHLANAIKFAADRAAGGADENRWIAAHRVLCYERTRRAQSIFSSVTDLARFIDEAAKEVEGWPAWMKGSARPR